MSSTSFDSDDIESVYAFLCENVPKSNKVILQNTMRTAQSESLFYTNVLVQDKVELKGMMDTGSMATTISADIIPMLKQAGVMTEDMLAPADIVLVGCGGKQTSPLGLCDLKLEVYGYKFLVPVLFVKGQIDPIVLGTNVLKPLIRHFKSNDGFWRVVSKPDSPCQNDSSQFLRLLSNLERWRGESIPDKVGTLKLKSAVTLQPMTEHLVWGRLPMGTVLSACSTVLIEPSAAACVNKQIMVGRIVSPLWGDGWLPMKIINPTSAEITLRRNSKIADVFPCIALEDFDQFSDTLTVHQNVGKVRSNSSCCSLTARSLCSNIIDVNDKLEKLGLGTIPIGNCEVSLQCKEKLVDLIETYESVFSRHHLDCGEARDFCHRIRLTDDRPFRLPYRRISPAHYHKLKETLDEMEAKEIIRKSCSEFASPLVLVWKKNGDLRICTDFRWLNARTVKDAHPLPHQSDVLAALGGNMFFSTMDLTAGYYNIPLHELDRKYTAFSSPLGLHEYNRLPQGLCNSPATFMRMMLTIFGDQNFLSLLCYLDDLLVFAKTEEESLARLEMVFRRLKEHNLKLSPSKCQFLRRSVKFLGHVISQNGISRDPDKVEAIVKVTEADLMELDGVTPSPSKIRSFLGMVIYYQHFIENCSVLAKPLFGLTGGQKRPRKSKSNKRPLLSRKLGPDDWTQECKQAFGDLKAALIEEVLLAHPDFSKPFILSVDASTAGLGAVLSQIHHNSDKAQPIAFASKSLNHAQAKYPAHRLEFFAMKWAICNKFSHWLRGHRFTVWTDNNPLKYILTKPRLDACEQRWVAQLAPFDFDIQYIPGTKNVVADALSREPFVQSKILHRLTRAPYSTLLKQAANFKKDDVQNMFRLSTELPEMRDVNAQFKTGDATFEAVCIAGSVWVSSDEISAVMQTHQHWEDAGTVRAISHVQYLESLVAVGQNAVPVFNHDELLTEQVNDAVVGRVKFFIDRGRRPSRREKVHESRGTLRILRQWGKLNTRLGIVYRVSKHPVTKQKTYQYVVPESLRMAVLKGIHDDAGHQGQQRSLGLARQRFYWDTMEKDVKDYVHNCKRCIVSKSPEPEARAPLVSITTSSPLELVCIDFWSAEDHNNKSVDVLVVTDHFTKLACAYPCSNQSAKTVARVLWNNFFCVYGFPVGIHSDQGANFESLLIAELCQLAGIDKTHTTPYHPMGNGQVERMNRTLGNMIRALPPRSKVRWPQMLNTLTFAYNCTVHETTGFSPFFLMYGRTPRLPVDLMFESVLLNGETVDIDKYVQSLKRDLCEAMKLAQSHSGKQQHRQAELYNKRSKGQPVDIGQRVLLANKGERGKKKLADRWESTVYIVIDKNSLLNTYKLRSPSGVVKTVHRNLIMPVDFLPLPDTEAVEEQLPSLSDDELESSSFEYSADERTTQWVADLSNSTGGPVANSELDEQNVMCEEIAQANDVDLVTSATAECDVTFAGVDSCVDCDKSGCGPSECRSGNQDDSASGVILSTEYDMEVEEVHEENPVNEPSPTVQPSTFDQTELSVKRPDQSEGFRTRHGRLVKPLNRLIQTMSNQFVKNLFGENKMIL